jgi:hypothetical protein
MISKIFIILILIVSCSGNYDDEQNYGEYVPEIFMGSSGS